MKYSVIPTISNIKNKFPISLFPDSKYRPEYFWSLVTLSITWEGNIGVTTLQFYKYLMFEEEEWESANTADSLLDIRAPSYLLREPQFYLG